MSIAEDIRELGNPQESLLEFYERAMAYLSTVCGKGGAADLGGPQFRDGLEAYRHVSFALAKTGALAAAEALLIEVWDELGFRQLEENRSFPREMIAFFLANINLTARNPGIGFRWLLYTHAQDVLRMHSDIGGAGRDLLRTLYGLSSAAVQQLTDTALTCREVVRQHQTWKIPEAFPEEVLRRLSISQGEYTN
jgi:hypothetical protein